MKEMRTIKTLDAPRAVLREEFIAVMLIIKKRKDLKSINLYTLRSRKRKSNSPQQGKEGHNRVEINETIEKTIEKVNRTKVGSLK